MTTTIHNTQEASADSPTLPTRVFMVERDVKDLRANMDRGFADVRAEQTSNHSELKGLIGSIATAQAERSKIQWPAIGDMVTVLGVAGTLLYSPLKERQAEILEAVHDRITRSEFVTTLTSIGARRDDAQRGMEERVGRVEGAVDHLGAAVVPRGEIDAHWADQRDRDAIFRAELDALSRPGPSYPAPRR